MARTLDLAGPVATVTAGWQEREPDDAELDALLDGRAVNLRLYARWLDVLDRDPDYAAAEREHRAALRELQQLYLITLDRALRALHEVARHGGHAVPAALADAEHVVRLVDERHLARVATPAPTFDAAARIAERHLVARTGPMSAEVVTAASALVVAGGPRRGAAARAAPVRGARSGRRDRLVRRGDGADRAGAAVPRPPRTAPSHAEFLDSGLGWCCPAACCCRTRAAGCGPRTPARMSELAPRSPRRGAWSSTTASASTSGRRRVLPPDARVVTDGGSASGSDRMKRTCDQPAARTARRTPPPSTGSSTARPPRGADRRGRPVHLPVAREADEVHLVQRIVGLPDRIPLRRLWGTDLWYVVVELPEGSRVEYQLEVRRGEHVESCNDPLNPKLSHSPVGTSSVCFAHGYAPRTGPCPTRTPGPASSPSWWCPAGRCAATAGSRCTCPPGSAAPRLPAAGGARRQRLPAVRRGEDGAGQPDPPARRGRGRWSRSCTRGPAGRVRRTPPRTPASSPGSWCRSSRPSCRWSASAPAGACSARASARSRRCPRLPRTGHLRLARADVRLVRLHRHRQPTTGRAGVRPGGAVRQPVPGPPAPGRRPRVRQLRRVRAADRPNRSMVPTFESTGMAVRYARPATGTAGRTGATGCATRCRGSTPARRSWVYEWRPGGGRRCFPKSDRKRTTASRTFVCSGIVVWTGSPRSQGIGPRPPPPCLRAWGRY